MARRIVINDVLCLVSNNLQFVDDARFSSLVSKFYKNSQILEAKAQLWRDLRFANSKKFFDENFLRVKYDALGDIVRMMKHVAQGNLKRLMPLYCVSDLGNLPFLKYGEISMGVLPGVDRIGEKVEKIENMVGLIASRVSRNSGPAFGGSCTRSSMSMKIVGGGYADDPGNHYQDAIEDFKKNLDRTRSKKLGYLKMTSQGDPSIFDIQEADDETKALEAQRSSQATKQSLKYVLLKSMAIAEGLEDTKSHLSEAEKASHD